MAMHEATRLQYLALLGIEQWVPRDAVMAAEDVADTATSVAMLAAVAPVDVAPAEAAGSRPPPAGAAQLDALLAGEPAPPRGVRDAPVVVPSPAVAVVAPERGERVGCSLLPVGDGLLLVAAYITPQAPGLSGPEYALLANIVTALRPAAALPTAIEFNWPPVGVRVPGMDRPGAGREALLALLDGQRKRDPGEVIVLGEELGALLAGSGDRPGLVAACVPSLATMLADPAAKRACWAAVRHLRREPH